MGFDKETIDAVWEKGQVVPNYDPSIWRKDKCGAFITRNQYGNTNSEYGWEIDHIIPVSKGGTDALSNLQPLQWKNNRHKADEIHWSCLIKSN